MSIKKRVRLEKRLEKAFRIKFSELDAAFYSSRRNMNIHMGLEKTIFSYSNINQVVEQIINFLTTT